MKMLVSLTLLPLLTMGLCCFRISHIMSAPASVAIFPHRSDPFHSITHPTHISSTLTTNINSTGGLLLAPTLPLFHTGMLLLTSCHIWATISVNRPLRGAATKAPHLPRPPLHGALVVGMVAGEVPRVGITAGVSMVG